MNPFCKEIETESVASTKGSKEFPINEVSISPRARLEDVLFEDRSRGMMIESMFVGSGDSRIRNRQSALCGWIERCLLMRLPMRESM